MERFSRQTTNPAPASPAPASSGSHGGTKNWLDKPTFASKMLVATLIAAALAVFLAIAATAWGSFQAKSLVNEDQFQAVFLDNGQVYFGKLSDVNGEYVRLTNIFYLQVEQQIQPDQDDPNTPDDGASPQISLAKLGNELHGPEDVMYIQRSKVVFWENLKSEGQVVQAINNFESNGGQSNTQQQDSGNDATNIEAEEGSQ